MAPRTGPRARVVFNGCFLAQPHTGVRRYALETLRALDELLDESPTRLHKARYELALPDGTTAPTLSAVHTSHVPGRAGHRWEQWPLRRYARGAFLVNFSYSGPWLKHSQLVTVHDATVRVMPETFSRSYRWFHNASVSLLGRHAKSVMTVSNFSRDELQQHFGIARADIVVGVKGGEHACRQTDDDAVLRRHGLTSHAYVLSVGSEAPNKNFGVLAHALDLLPDFPWPIAVAGARDIGAFRGTAGRTAGFQFLGFVPEDDLPALYRQAACFVLPSVYEGFGLPAVEAMANDCPVLAAHAASLPEVCGDAALYFDPHDPASVAAQLMRMAAEPELRIQLAAAGRLRLRYYSWTTNAHILLDHLDAIGVTG